MSVVCIEGPSAIGKSTISNILSESYGYFVVPEVSALFTRPKNESDTWYFEMQVERWKLAASELEKGRSVVFDGDPLQPLWYNWVFENGELQAIDLVISFYTSAIEVGEIEFPEKYFLMNCPESELKRRKDNDKSRNRGNFEKHLKLIKPQIKYFETMRSISPGKVEFMENLNPILCAQCIDTSMPRDLTSTDSSNLIKELARFVTNEHNKQFKK